MNNETTLFIRLASVDLSVIKAFVSLIESGEIK